ncbi:hypothetical protein RJ639_042259 [Escallonia herrerae]|uniref:Tetrapyrrole biosynthesis uroporphyrinogen III synthase domain-containing protein n=1 Tax=Escallonia herrerae TaxID=1293975 RepID=A0AA89B610_9ASTE|nr:hypothetical protein RJ639_042259 [Escallonia herrerae]
METPKALQNLQLPLPSPNNNASRVVAFTTPQSYAARLSHLLHLKGWSPLWCPTVVVEPTPHTKSNLQRYLSSTPQTKSRLQDFSAIAFTSRIGISAFTQAMDELALPPLSPFGNTFTISALGRDSELLNDSFVSQICKNPERIRILIPPVATPTGLVESLGFGRGKRVLCPVPLVVGLEEPLVVPGFLRDLSSNGWVAARVDGYETRWAGKKCAEVVVGMSSEEGGGGLDAVVFTSTAEVEGLLKSLEEFGLDWEAVRKRCPQLVVAAHGPVTASGAERLGVGVDVVSSRFDSFGGVVDALAFKWKSLEC